MSSLKAQADQGDAAAQLEYGRCLVQGDGVDQDIPEGVRYCKKAADAGNTAAQVFYARLLDEGDGIARNTSEAARYFKMAMDKGDADAAWEYGLLRKYSEGKDRDFEEALRSLKIADEKGNSHAHSAYKRFFRDVGNLHLNQAEATAFFELARKNSHWEGVADYGMALRDGKFVKCNVDKGFQYVTEAKDHCKWGETCWSKYFSDLISVPLSVLQHLANLALKEKHWQGCLECGLAMRDRAGEHDFLEGARCVKRACDQKSGGAKEQAEYKEYFDYQHAANLPPDEAVKFFKAAVTLEHDQGMLEYATALMEGRENISRDPHEALSVLKQLAQRKYGTIGWREPGRHIYKWIQRNQNDLSPSDKFEFYKVAAEGWSHEAKSQYGWMLRTGEGCQRNLKEAYDVVKEAYELLHSESNDEHFEHFFDLDDLSLTNDEIVKFYQIAIDKKDGRGVAKYVQWLQKNKGQGPPLEQVVPHLKECTRSSHAVMEYAKCLRDGIGVERNPQAALEYLKEHSGDLTVTAAYNELREELEFGGDFSPDAALLEKMVSCAPAPIAVYKDSDPSLFYGYCFQQGWGVEKNDCQAATFFRRSATGGSPQGCLEFGKCLLHGTGRNQNLRDAMEYLRKADEKKIPGAAEAISEFHRLLK